MLRSVSAHPQCAFMSSDAVLSQRQPSCLRLGFKYGQPCTCKSGGVVEVRETIKTKSWSNNILLSKALSAPISTFHSFSSENMGIRVRNMELCNDCGMTP